MAFSYRELFCGGKTFCCCLPVRMGVIIMSLLGILFGGFFTIVLWFEVANTVDMTSGERAGFVIAGLVESLLFIASILGFVGTIVRKQLFVQIYTYFIYVHFLLNIGVAGYLLYMVTHFSKNATVKACQETIQNQQAKDQCTGLLKVTRGIYVVVAAIVLLVELYGALIVTRYVNQVKNEKRSARASRLDNEEAFSLVTKGKDPYSSLPDGQDRGRAFTSLQVYSGESGEEFDPYQGIREGRRSSAYDGVPSDPEGVGYGGGFWTHSDISSEEKARLKQREVDIEEEAAEEVRQETESRDSDVKSREGPPLPTLRAPDELPRYTLSDPPRGPTPI
ncbi:hypothetical protein D9615_004473 [Tricholomella constricta]|uniref:Uncharacterized protein n=1 Tax=Tricholomella constricta TaxID=117010 RepID=A0A8H5HBT3_9AGAR|nr:hypothetical protein D9615_004473 [Tricholomella constricta]